jgi:hypothetical protein
MPLTAAQIASFFEDDDQMGLTNDTVNKLVEEGIDVPSDLADFDKDTLKQVAENLRKPGGRVPNPDPNAPAGATIETPPFLFGAKSQKRLLEAGELIRFYITIGRQLTPGNIRYDPVIKDFTEQWRALALRQEEEDPEVPKISKALPIIKWTEAFDDFLSRKVGARTIPLAYVTRESDAVGGPAPPLAQDKPHSLMYGSVEGDLVARASHGHALFREDNSSVYYFLEEATRGTAYAASMKPFQRAKNGREAYLSIRNQYAGKDKWEAEIKKQDDLLHNRQWKGQTNFTLEKFVSQHRNAYVSMQQCSEHVAFQLPNEHTRVGYLLDAIQTSDAGLQAAIAMIATDDGPNGKRNDFEATAAYLLPYDPVAKKRNLAGKRGDREASISDVSAEVSAGFGSKPGLGKTGVHLRYYTKDEYYKLTNEQKAELKEWRTSKDSKGTGKSAKKKGGKQSDGKDSKKGMVAAITKELLKQLKPKEDDDNEIDGIIAALQTTTNSDAASSEEPATKKARFQPTKSTQVSTAALKSILRRVRNGKDEE